MKTETETELHKALLEFACPNVHPAHAPKLDSNLIRQCHENMTKDQMDKCGTYLAETVLFGTFLSTTKITVSEMMRIIKESTIPQQAAAIIIAVGKE